MKNYKLTIILLLVAIFQSCTKEEQDKNSFDLSGTWFTDNIICQGSSEIREVINITQTADSIIAIKTQSVGCVTVGEVSFRGANILVDESFYEIIWTTGSFNNPNCCTSPGRLSINEESCTFDAVFESKTLQYLRDANQIEYNIPGDFYLIPQPSRLTCWAATLAMMISWRDQVKYTIENVLSTNPPYLQQFQNNTILGYGQIRNLFYDYGMVEIPFCENAKCFKDLLEKHGPLLVFTASSLSSNNGHARVLTAIRGDGNDNCSYMEFYDPAKSGHQKVDTYSEFETLFKALPQGEYPRILGFPK